MTQEKCNIELPAFKMSNTSLRKKNVELSDEKKDLSAKVVELKSWNEELNDNYAKLVKENAKVVGRVDAVIEELAKEKAENATLKAKLESTVKKMQFIVVDAILHDRAK